MCVRGKISVVNEARVLQVCSNSEGAPGSSSGSVSSGANVLASSVKEEDTKKAAAAAAGTSSVCAPAVPSPLLIIAVALAAVTASCWRPPASDAG